MSEPISELAKQAEKLGKIKASDHVVNNLKALFSAAPFVGGPIVSLIDD